MTCSCGGSCSTDNGQDLRKWSVEQALIFLNTHMKANETQKHIDFTKADHDFVLQIASAFYDYVEDKADEIQD